MHTMQNVQNMQNSLLLTERTSALWAVYDYFLYIDIAFVQLAQPFCGGVQPFFNCKTSFFSYYKVEGRDGQVGNPLLVTKMSIIPHNQGTEPKYEAEHHTIFPKNWLRPCNSCSTAPITFIWKTFNSKYAQHTYTYSNNILIWESEKDRLRWKPPI